MIDGTLDGIAVDGVTVVGIIEGDEEGFDEGPFVSPIFVGFDVGL